MTNKNDWADWDDAQVLRSTVYQKLNMESAKWRERDGSYAKNAKQMGDAIAYRWNEGEAEYGPYFVGDPIKNGFEEIADLVNYIHAANKQIQFFMECITEAVAYGTDKGLDIQEMIPSMFTEADTP